MDIAPSSPKSTSAGAADVGILWIIGFAALYFAMQLWILPKFGIST